MDQNIDKATDLREKLSFFYKKNKLKIIILIIFTITSLLLLSYYKIYNDNQKKIISERYIQAGIYLSSNQIEESSIIFEEIINSKNEFYSLLALNTILERDLKFNESKILEFFKIVENLNITREQQDLLKIKKALFLIKNSNESKGKELLKKILNSDSKFKKIAEEILSD